MTRTERIAAIRQFSLQDWSFIVLRVCTPLLLLLWASFAPGVSAETAAGLRFNILLFSAYSVVEYCFVFWLPDHRGITYMAVIPLDIAVVTAVVQLTGGLVSDFVLLYLLLAVVYASMYGLLPGLGFAVVLSAVHLFANNEIIYHMATGRGILSQIDPALRHVHWNVPLFRIAGLFLVTGAVGAFATRYKAMFRRLRQANHKFESVNQITEAIRSSMKLGQVIEISLQKVHEDLEFERVFLYLVEEEGLRKSLRYQRGIGVPDDYLKGKTYLLGQGVSEAAKVGATGIISRVAETRRPQNVLNARNNFMCDQELVEKLNLNSFAAVPLRVGDRVVGVMVVDNYGDTAPVPHEDIESLSLFANQAAIAIENARLHEETEKLAILDGLTNIYNHRYFQEFLTGEVERARRYGNSVSLLLSDIDFFKTYNDSWGHPEGDEVLRNVARLFRESVRDIDVVARYGGEEFVVVLPQTAKQEAVMIAERIRSSVAGAEFKNQDRQPNGNLTVSIGVASYPEDAPTKEKLITAADAEVYRAKESGKNRVCYRTESGDAAVPAGAPGG